MNERMKELAERAGLKLDNLPDDVYIPLEQFVELIVHVYLNEIETYRVPVGNSPAGELARDLTYNALKEIRDEIKAYFGVE